MNNIQNTTHDQDTPRGMPAAARAHRASPALTAATCEDRTTTQHKTSPRTHSHKPNSDITTRNEPNVHYPANQPAKPQGNPRERSTISCYRSSHRSPRNDRASYDTRVTPPRPPPLAHAYRQRTRSHNKTRNAPKWDKIHENQRTCSRAGRSYAAIHNNTPNATHDSW